MPGVLWHWFPMPDPQPALCVDLDGTLVKSDTLVDSVLALVRQNPRALLQIPGWLAQDKAAFKQHVTAAVTLDVAHLPYNTPLLEFLFHQQAAGRSIYLATAANAALAHRVAAHHAPLFAGVLASDSSLNLAGTNKLAAFQQQFGDQFSYIGNASPDLPILKICREPMLANPSRALSRGLHAAGITPAHTFHDRASPLKAWLRAIRLHQWAKNTLIFLPLLLAHAWHTPGAGGVLLCAVLAFLSFGLCASATYILNDLLDIEADRRHPTKRRRPFAAGNLSAIAGAAVLLLFLAASVILALALPWLAFASTFSSRFTPTHPYAFLAWLVIYAVSTTAYSFVLKRIVLVDVIVLSGLYTIRIIAGSAATSIPVSTWLAGFSIFFFLSLAFVKRFSELEGLRLRHNANRRHDQVAGEVSPAPPTPPANGRGYLVSDIEQLRTFGTSAAYASVVVLTLYISALDRRLYSHPGRLWLLVPVLLLWVSQLWLLASRGQLHEDPVLYAITNRGSLLLGLLVLAIVYAAL